MSTTMTFGLFTTRDSEYRLDRLYPNLRDYLQIDTLYYQFHQKYKKRNKRNSIYSGRCVILYLTPSLSSHITRFLS